MVTALRLLGVLLLASCQKAPRAVSPAPLGDSLAAPSSPAGAAVSEPAAASSSSSAHEDVPEDARTLHHVLSTGQSLAVGVSGVPVTSTSQPFANLMFGAGVMPSDDPMTSFVPLVEGDTIPGSKAVVETMSAAFANLVTQLSPNHSYRLLMSVHASGAKTYRQLKKGTRPYERGMEQVRAGMALAKAQGLPYVVTAVTNVHGESDHAEKSTRYKRDLVEWQADYEHDVQAITGQTAPIPMFETQMSSFTRMMRGTETSAIPQAQLDAATESGGKIVLVGPKYHLHYTKDGVHLTGAGYRHMGEDYAKAYRRVVVEKKTWEPLRPASITRDGATITVKMLVPEPPLVLDTQRVTDPGHFGFEYTDSSAAPPAITKVSVNGDTVVVTLAAAPTADGKRLRYAFTGVRGARSGPETGARGNLRDSDSTTSRTGDPLYNWCVHFDEAVP